MVNSATGDRSPSCSNSESVAEPSVQIQRMSSMTHSRTLGTKCNTQVVIPNLTENYGASRDPPERQSPMCTVHSFPHNIDLCLTWARSEFEGLLEKTPAEANAFLSTPEEYTNAMKNAGDLKPGCFWSELWNVWLQSVASHLKSALHGLGSSLRTLFRTE